MIGEPYPVVPASNFLVVSHIPGQPLKHSRIKGTLVSPQLPT